jgi:hypothetical protein
MRLLVVSFIGLAGTLAACSGPQIVQETAPSVSFRVDQNGAAEATARADRYCQNYGKRARLTSTQPTTTGEQIAHYECG